MTAKDTAMNGSQKFPDSDPHKIYCNYSSQEIMKMEAEYGCNNYAPLPVVIAKAKGAWVTDVEGKRYLDALAGYGSVNQGHCHDRLVLKMIEQAPICTLTSRAFYNDKLAIACKFLTAFFKYDRLLPMNTGVEAAESCIKIMRRYAYEVKKVPEDQAIILFPEGNFWGRSIAAVSASSDPDSYTNYGPFVPNFMKIPFGDIDALAKVLEIHGPRVAGLFTEPIQGEAGIVIPPLDYLVKAQALLHKHKALLACDEIQSGLGRCGYMLASEHFKCKPDLVVLGKALTGGMMPVSCVMGPHDVMLLLTPGTHGSTYGGNPLGMAIAVEAIQILEEENLCEKSRIAGEKLRKGLAYNLGGFVCKCKKPECRPIQVRGVGMFTAVEVCANFNPSATALCKDMLKLGLLCKPTHNTVIRITPPLMVSESDIDFIVQNVTAAFKERCS